MSVLEIARLITLEVPVLVRTRDDSLLTELKVAGATEVVPELLESSLMLASHALIMLGLPEKAVQRRVNQVRHDRYHLLEGCFETSDTRETSVFTHEDE